MEHLTVTKEFKEAELPNRNIGEIARQLFLSASGDFKVALMAGCRMDVLTEEKDGMITFRIKTHNLISILKYPDGRIMSVIEKHP